MTEEELKVAIQSEIYRNDINNKMLDTISGLRASLERLIRDVEVWKNAVQNEHKKFNDSQEDFSKSFNQVFNKIREINENLETIEDKLVDKNNEDSLIVVMSRLIEEQNKNLTDKNNDNSIISIINKNENTRSWITWILLTVLGLLDIIGRFFN